MATHGKKYQAAKAEVDSAKRYNVNEAIEKVLAVRCAKFDESVDVAVVLGVDPRKADQNIRGSVVLPHGTGRTPKVLVIAKGEKIKEAEEADADYVGGEDLAEKIQGGWVDFDKAVATPDMMGVVGRLGRILGPRGLMPNAKTGTVTFDIGKAVKDIKAGKVDFRVDKGGVVHAPLGRMSFGSEKIRANFAAFLEALQRLKPHTSKGAYIQDVAISATMGPGVKIDTAEARALAV